MEILLEIEILLKFRMEILLENLKSFSLYFEEDSATFSKQLWIINEANPIIEPSWAPSLLPMSLIREAQQKALMDYSAVFPEAFQ